MKQWIWAVPVAVLALAGCDPKKKPPDTPTPKVATDRAVKAVAESSPASDPSLPPATVAASASGSAAAR